jgi:hypothetical protein
MPVREHKRLAFGQKRDGANANISTGILKFCATRPTIHVKLHVGLDKKAEPRRYRYIFDSD